MTKIDPCVGDTVHYVSYGTPGGEYPSVCRAAIVTAVDKYQDSDTKFIGHLSLCVLNPEGMFFNRSVLQQQIPCIDPNDEQVPKGGTWHWPERV